MAPIRTMKPPIHQQMKNQRPIVIHRQTQVAVIRTQVVARVDRIVAAAQAVRHQAAPAIRAAIARAPKVNANNGKKF